MANFDVHDAGDHKAKAVLLMDPVLKQRIAYSGNLREYIGEAKDPGAATSDAKWRIKKLTHTGNLLTAVNWADGSNDFNKVWDDRATYTYS